MNIISHNCVSGRIYNKKNLKYGNPFMWCVIPPDDFYYLYSNYNEIDFNNITLIKENFYKVVIDNKVNVYYVHYLYDKNATIPVKKTPIDIVYNRIDEYIIEKYKTRLERMKEKPIFIVTDREFIGTNKWSMKRDDIIKYLDKDDCIVAVYDKSIVGKNVVYMPQKNLDPKYIADLLINKITNE